MIKVYPNQKTVTLHKAQADAAHPYGIFNKEALFAACRLLTGNELKVFLYLISNQQGYCWALSPEAIAKKVGSNTDGIRTAIRGLISKGYLVKRGSNAYDAYEEVLASSLENSSLITGNTIEEVPESLMLTLGKSSGYLDETSGEIVKGEYRKNSTEYIVNDDPLELSDEWKNIFRDINVTPHPHTLHRLNTAVGKAPDPRVIYRVITENRYAFQKGVNEKEGYRLGTLANLAKAEYAKWEAVIAREDEETSSYLKDLMNRPKINYDRLPALQDTTDNSVDIVQLMLHDESIWGRK